MALIPMRQQQISTFVIITLFAFWLSLLPDYCPPTLSPSAHQFNPPPPFNLSCYIKEIGAEPPEVQQTQTPINFLVPHYSVATSGTTTSLSLGLTYDIRHPKK